MTLELTRAERDLLLYFLQELSGKMGRTGCNDMDQSILNSMDPVDRLDLHSAFLEYDRRANPDGWEPKVLTHIPDFCWVGYLEDKIEGMKL